MKKCFKRRYKDRVSAELSLAIIRREDKSHRGEQECRSYFCDRCRGHHLTHLPEWGNA